MRQLEHQDHDEIRAYYETAFSQNHILQILGHEFVHHSDLFLEDFASDRGTGIWFEEGMCEYISRKYFLTQLELESLAHINSLLVTQYGFFSLESFGEATYQEDYASIFVGYWRSYLAVQELVDRYSGDVLAVFREYHRWAQSGSPKTLAEWFHIG